jgi:hypothetical protein
MASFPFAQPACGAVSPGGALCGYAPHTAGLHSWEGIREPVDKGFREEFVAADQMLYRLAERGHLADAARVLGALLQWHDRPDGPVRKGALAEDRMSRSPDVAVACDDLARLADFGAMAGVAEIIRERLRQVDPCGYDAAHDTLHGDGWLMHEAVRRVENAGQRVTEGIDGAEGIEEGCRQGGALLAAEMDRLLLMLTPGTVTIEVDP